MNPDHLEGNSTAVADGSEAPTISSERASKKATFREPFEPDHIDGVFALFVFVLGFYFARWVLVFWQGWGVTLFTTAFCSAITLYLIKKGVQISRSGWFWLAIVVLTGLSFSLWTNNGLEPWRSLLLFGSAVYWIISACGVTILGETSSLVMLDGINGLFVIPFENAGCQYKSLSFVIRNSPGNGRQIFSVALGLFLGLIVLSAVLPMLLKADSGGFTKLTLGATTWLQAMRLGESLVQGALAVPIAAYLFGLVAGSAHKRGTAHFKADDVLKSLSKLRVMPMATVYTVLALLCLLYVLFVGSQLPYFFSAFVGERPEGWQVYSEYARSGFFELCRITAVNLSVLLVINIMSTRHSRSTITLRILNSLLAILTMVLIATAFSKMIMYIGAYGLSVRRLLPCFFMFFLALVCGGVVALQKWQFPITRLAVGLGVVMLCTLCLVDPDAFVARYNAQRYLSGTLSSFDLEMLDRSGPAGVEPALQVYLQTGDQELRARIKDYLLNQQQQAERHFGLSRDNLQWARVRGKVMEYTELQGAVGTVP